MEDVRWFGKLLSKFDDEIWRMGQVFRQLQEYRKDIRRQWDDAASRKINSRYLNPHEEDTQKMIKDLIDQKQKLGEINKCLALVHDQGVQANIFSLEIESILCKAQDEIKRSYANYDIHREKYLASKNKLPKVYELINKADSMRD